MCTLYVCFSVCSNSTCSCGKHYLRNSINTSSILVHALLHACFGHMGGWDVQCISLLQSLSGLHTTVLFQVCLGHHQFYALCAKMVKTIRLLKEHNFLCSRLCCILKIPSLDQNKFILVNFFRLYSALLL